MRKYVLAAAGLVVLTAAETKPGQAIYITNGEIQATLRKAPSDSATDQQVRVLDVGKTNVGVGVVYRSEKANQSAVEHDNITEVYETLEGAGTMVTGGEIVAANGKAIAHDSKGPSGPSSRGASIRGGESHKVGPGDIVVIPPGVAHLFTQVEGTIKYAVIRVDPDRVLPLR
jgi:mannose-6-phosphate isomerase-like protein (cupin superfamily)